MKLRSIKQAMKGEPPATLVEKARKAAYEYAAEHGLAIDQVGVRASVFGTVTPFTIQEGESSCRQ